jgi:hypothetical protein
VAVLGKAARCSDRQRGYGTEYGFIIHAPFVDRGWDSLQPS